MSNRNDYWAYLSLQNDGLAHYGVKGMKWGVRKEPERVGGIRRFRTDGGDHRGLSSKQKSALKVAAGAALIVGGSAFAYKMNRKLVATGGRSMKALANKQAMKLAASSPKVKRAPKNYSRFVEKSRGVRSSGSRIRSTRGHLTGHSMLTNKAGAQQHRVVFYADRYTARNNKVAPDVYDFERNRLHSELVNARDQARRTNQRARYSGDLYALKRYRRG